MTFKASSLRPGVLVHLVAIVVAAVGVYWAWSGMASSAQHRSVIAGTHQPVDALGSVPAPEFHDWTTGDIGKMITTCGLSVEALNVSNDEEEMVARVVGSYDRLHGLTGKLMQASGLTINSLSLKRSRRESQIEATIVLGIRRVSAQ
jgi:hypothetical protein